MGCSENIHNCCIFYKERYNIRYMDTSKNFKVVIPVYEKGVEVAAVGPFNDMYEAIQRRVGLRFVREGYTLGLPAVRDVAPLLNQGGVAREDDV
jgi:hypothetical protein